MRAFIFIKLSLLIVFSEGFIRWRPSAIQFCSDLSRTRDEGKRWASHHQLFTLPAKFYEIPETVVTKDIQAKLERRVRTLPVYLQHEVNPAHTVVAYEEAVHFVDKFYERLPAESVGPKFVILDSGCGKGMSSVILARKYPHIPVLGIDRSIHRLSKNDYFINDSDDVVNSNQFKIDSLDNLLLLRAELTSFFLLACLNSDWTIYEHYILHPNPYPKTKLENLRYYLHPSFPLLCALGGKTVVRSTWKTYCKEFGVAVDACSVAFNFTNVEIPPSPLLLNIDVPMTGFEKKYSESKVPIYEIAIDLGLRNKNERHSLLDGLGYTICEHSS